MRVNESWQARVCMSVSSTPIARSNEQWELHESWRVFSIFSFLLVASMLLFLRFLMLVKLLTDFLIIIIMGNDLDIACFWFILSVRKPLRNISHFVESGTAKWKPLAIYNSHWLSCNSRDWSNEPNLSLTLIKIWTSSKLMRVYESSSSLILVWSGLNTILHSQ